MLLSILDSESMAVLEANIWDMIDLKLELDSASRSGSSSILQLQYPELRAVG